MPKLYGTGPEGEGSLSGRGLGLCLNEDKAPLEDVLGRGMGLRRQSGGGKGERKRLKSGTKTNQ